MKLKIILLLLLFGAFTCFSQAWIQDKTASKITFKIKNFGLNVAGVFKNFTSSSNFNAANGETRFFNAEIDVKSIFTGIEIAKDNSPQILADAISKVFNRENSKFDFDLIEKNISWNAQANSLIKYINSLEK
jgi:hypothetical protein